ncbi:DNA-directed RNA polymerase subunit omega, partial [Dysosmobacter welbionis]
GEGRQNLTAGVGLRADPHAVPGVDHHRGPRCQRAAGRGAAAAGRRRCAGAAAPDPHQAGALAGAVRHRQGGLSGGDGRHPAGG